MTKRRKINPAESDAYEESKEVSETSSVSVDSESHDSYQPNVIGNAADLSGDSEEEFFFTKEDYLKALKAMRYEKEMSLATKKKHRVILWFRNDLRVHDSAIINWAMS